MNVRSARFHGWSPRPEARSGEATAEALDTRLHGTTLAVAQTSVAVILTVAVGLFVASLPAGFAHFRTICAPGACSAQLTPAMVRQLDARGLSVDFYATFLLAVTVVFSSVYCATAATLVWRRSQERMALFAAVMLVTAGTTVPPNIHALATAHPAWGCGARGLTFLADASFFTFCFLFPDGRFVPGWTRTFAIGAVAAAAAERFLPGSSDDWPLVFQLLPFFGLLLPGVAVQVYRYRRISTLELRQPTKWVVFGIVVALGGFLAIIALFTGVPALQADPLLNLAGQILLYAVLLALPLSLALAILRSRLWDIDVVINRALVYGALTTGLLGLYISVVVGVGTLPWARGTRLVSIIATALVAVLFAPLRERVQRGVDRMLYGERRDPYAVLSRLGQRLEAASAPGTALQTIVEDVARALKLPHVAIWLGDGEVLRLGAVYGGTPSSSEVRDGAAVSILRQTTDGVAAEDLGHDGAFSAVLAAAGVALVLPLHHRGEAVGALCLGARRPGEGFTGNDRRLLRDLASQAGAATRAEQLTIALRGSLSDLRRSREELVLAQEEERRRIQHDLHDGLGPTLASMRLRLEACFDLAQGKPSLVADLVRLHGLVGQATTEIRRLVYDLRPPILDQVGLVPALHQHVERFGRETGIRAGFVAQVDLVVPAAAEVTVLRVAQEALVNVQKHARAGRVDVKLEERDGWLVLKVGDDGRGFAHDAALPVGTGLGSMRDRAVLLGGDLDVVSERGGGTEVVMRVPLGRQGRD